MMTQTLTLHLPVGMFQRLQQMAQTTRQPVEEIACQAIQGNLPPLLADAPPEWRDDLAQFHQLNDAALWTIAQETPPSRQWKRHQQLLQRNQNDVLTAAEQHELETLRLATDRLVLRRSYALALLKWRGHALFSNREPEQ